MGESRCGSELRRYASVHTLTRRPPLSVYNFCWEIRPFSSLLGAEFTHSTVELLFHHISLESERGKKKKEIEIIMMHKLKEL